MPIKNSANDKNHQRFKLLLSVRIGHVGLGLNDLSVVRNQFGVDWICLGVDTNAFGKVSNASWINDRYCDRRFVKQVNQQNFVPTRRFHDNQRLHVL